MSISGLFPIDKWSFKSRSILCDLPAEDHNLLHAHQTEHSYSKGEIIFREGGLPTGIYHIKKGIVKKFKTDDSRQQIIYVAGAGELVGYHAALSGERFSDSAVTLEHSTIAFIPRDTFLSVLEQSRTINTRLLQLLGHEFTVFVNNLTLFAQRPVRERFALQLILLREKYKPVPSATHLSDHSRPSSPRTNPGSDYPVTPQSNHFTAPVEINLSREDLANLVGARRENIVRTLAEFKQQGILTTKGRKIIVKDVIKLIQIANFK